MHFIVLKVDGILNLQMNSLNRNNSASVSLFPNFSYYFMNTTGVPIIELYKNHFEREII